ALSLDDTVSEAHDLHARILFAYDWDWDGAEREFQRAFELDPTKMDAHAVYAQFLAITGQWDRVLPEIELALEADPYNPFYQHQMGASLSWLGRYDEAISRFHRLSSLNPNSPPARKQLWTALFASRRFEEALVEASTFFELMGYQEVAETLTQESQEGNYAAAMSRAASRLIALSDTRYVGPATVARLYIHAADKDRAMTWLERSYAEHESRLVYVKVDRSFESLWNDPRFTDLMKRINLK
ncbi:MAG: hypothetical protein JSU96_15975, partial [Acidobacteriota bacterium]